MYFVVNKKARFALLVLHIKFLYFQNFEYKDLSKLNYNWHHKLYHLKSALFFV